MKSVEPIRDKKKIDAMKAILASGKYGQRNLVIFSIGINTAYRISDLRQLKLSDVLEISRGRVIVKERLAMKEQKTAKHNSVFISNKLRKVILDYVQSEFSEQLQAQDFSKYLFPSRKGADTPLTRQSLWRIIHEAGTAVGLKKLVPIRCARPSAIFCTSKGPKQRSFSRYSTILHNGRPYAILESLRKIKIPP